MVEGKVVRFGVSIPEKLLRNLDSVIREVSFANRSEAVRAAIRLLINKHKSIEGEEANVGVISLIYNREEFECQEKITEKQHLYEDVVKTSSHVHIGKNCLETVICIGEGKRIKKLFKEIESVKGIEWIDLSLAFMG